MASPPHASPSLLCYTCLRSLPVTCHAVQGEVEQISMMKPKGQTEHETGLLEYLEDIIGTDKYIACLDESAKRWVQQQQQQQQQQQEQAVEG